MLPPACRPGRSPRQRIIAIAISWTVIVLATAGAYAGDDDPVPPSPPSPPSLPSPSPPAPSRLSVHGYLTQAFAFAEEHPILGIPTEGTTDYRTLALQFRYALSPRDNLVAQLSHERFGQSPFAADRSDVELDWGFYERRFGGSTSVKVGKVQIPLGIYNEIRDVGTLLPFYRPAFNFYGEGAYASETVDGLVVSQSVARGGAWGADIDVYYGGFDLVNVDPTTGAVAVGRAGDDIGFQVWVSTPVSGLRAGAGAYRFSLRDQLLAPPEVETTVRAWHLSLDGSFDRFTLRGEIQRAGFRPGRYRGYYVQAGARLRPSLTANVQAEFSDLLIAVPFGPRFDASFQKDYALGLNWSFRSDVVLKLETHWTSGFRIDEPVDLFFGEPQRARYTILSLSASY